MEKVIVSKEKCLHCLYGVTGECEMYDEMGKPMDGETCSNYEEAGEDEMIEGERLVNGEITISDCIAYLTEQQEFHDPLSASGRRIQKSISYLREYKERMSVWHKPGDKPDRTREPILRLHRDMSAGTLFFSMLKSEEEVQMMMEGIVAWCYFEDLLPQWIKVYDYDKQNTKKCVMRDDELQSNTAKED